MGNNILFISYDGMTDPLGQSQVIPYLQGLSKAGYKITLLSFEKKARYLVQSKLIKDILDQSGISWQPLFFTKRPPFVSKIYDVWKLKAKARALHRQYQFNLVHCRSYVPASAGLHLSRKYNVPFLFDMRGFWVDERVDNGQWNLQNPFFRFFYKKYKKKEKAYFTEAKHIISLTWRGKQELIDVYGVPENKITVIPCCVDLAHFNYKTISQSSIDDKKKELGIKPGEKVISYLGSLGGWYLEKEMLDFFIEMKKSIPLLKFLFITQDPWTKVARAVLQSGASEQDIVVQPSMRKDVPLYLALSDWSIFFIKDAYSKRASSPTKQGEIMAMGIPIVCNDIGDTGKIISVSGAGTLVKNFNQEEYRMVSASLSILEQLSKENIRLAAAEYYDLQVGIERYLNVYKKIG